MALPSVVTIGSMAFVVAAGVGFAATMSAAAQPSAAPHHHSVHVSQPKAVKPLAGKVHGPVVKSPQQTDAVPHVLVVVYNNTAITGLASQKAAILEGAGWNVASTDNWYGNIPANTVYFPPKMRPAAVKLAKVLHITRLRPAVSPMQFDRLTVIFATG